MYSRRLSMNSIRSPTTDYENQTNLNQLKERGN